MKLKVVTFLVTSLALNTAMAQSYTCSNVKGNVRVQVALTSQTTADVEVKSPFQKQMKCAVNEFTNGKDVVKGFTCDNGEGLPDVLAINEKLMTGMIEVLDQPHYELICK